MSSRYDRRVESGVYSELCDHFVQSEFLTLHAATLGTHFRRQIVGKNFKYVSTTDETGGDCHFIAFGQTCSSILGTQMSSRGNKVNLMVVLFISCSMKTVLIFLVKNETINDRTPVKFVIVLGPPTKSDADTRALFNNQLVTLGDIRAVEEIEEQDAETVMDSPFRVIVPV
jgi:hypothetical protein